MLPINLDNIKHHETALTNIKHFEMFIKHLELIKRCETLIKQCKNTKKNHETLIKHCDMLKHTSFNVVRTARGRGVEFPLMSAIVVLVKLRGCVTESLSM